MVTITRPSVRLFTTKKPEDTIPPPLTHKTPEWPFNKQKEATSTAKQTPTTSESKISSTTSGSNVTPTKRSTAATIAKLQNQLVKVPPPRQLKNYLDNYIIGQDTGKKVMSVAVYNHYLRINDKARKHAIKLRKKQQEEDDEMYTLSNSVRPTNQDPEQISFNLENLKDEDLELSKSNIMLLGPSGSGKTLIAQTLARVINVPFSITDCTQLTQAGYIGEDVELCIERLLINADYDVANAEKGIVVLDEIDKLSKPSSSNGTKDVSGEGVQQALLKLIEGATVQVQVKKPVNKDLDPRNPNNNAVAKKNETYIVDTSNILFVLMGAFVGLDGHISRRLIEAGIEEKPSEEEDKRNSKHFIKQIKLKDGGVKPALEFVTPQDLTSFGMIPELIGRVPIITGLDSLNEENLLSILTEPKNALLNQYQYIFNQFNVKLIITRSALKKIAELSLKEGTGARGLRGIMERLLLSVNYECPDSGISFVLINSNTVDSLNSSKVNALYYGRGDVFNFIDDIGKEDREQALDVSKEMNIIWNDDWKKL